jgi:hypothetical protein
VTRAVYLLGEPGVGKSSVARGIVGWFDAVDPEPSTVHESRTNPLTGHRFDPGGLYLGKLREHFPGTDALGMTAGPTAVEWLESGGATEYSWLVGEGARLGTPRFLQALAEWTELTVVVLEASPEVVRERRAARPDHAGGWAKPVAGKIRTGPQSESYARGLVTKARNAAESVRDLATVVRVDANPPVEDVLAEVARRLLV